MNMSAHAHSRVRDVFDEIAPSYDRTLEGNKVMNWLRTESLAELESVFPAGALLLELGCGTGEEALALSRRGRHVVATDISSKMIEEAGKKPRRPGSFFPRWYVAAAGDLEPIAVRYGGQAFDGAFSSFGGLNCEPDLIPVARWLARLIKPGGRLVCSIMNKGCLWEVAWFLLHFHLRAAFRRIRSGPAKAPLTVSATRNWVAVRYYSPGGFAKAFSPHFRRCHLQSFPVFLPPPYLERLVSQRPRLFRTLETWERHFSKRYPWTHWGDHFLMVLERTSAGIVSDEDSSRGPGSLE
jgi:ubiquinone/menaquinone biosynthesis C-methylase UbiE